MSGISERGQRDLVRALEAVTRVKNELVNCISSHVDHQLTVRFDDSDPYDDPVVWISQFGDAIMLTHRESAESLIAELSAMLDRLPVYGDKVER